MEIELESIIVDLTNQIKLIVETNEYHSFQNFIKTVYSNLEEKSARILTINLIILTDKILSGLENVKAGICKEICCKILQSYNFYVSQKCKNLKLLKKILFAVVPDERWKKCFWALMNLDINQCSTLMGKLLHISKPEKKLRAEIITNAVKAMIDSEDREEFCNGVTWISVFNLEKLKIDEFRNIVYKSHIYQVPEALAKLLTTKRFNEEYLLTLDGCYERLLKGNPCLSELESNFAKNISIEVLSNLIQDEADRLEVDINKAEFHFYYIKITNELQHRFAHDERAMFEIFALNTLHSFKKFRRLEFINLLVAEPKYAYFWTKMLNLESHDIPEFVKQLSNIYESEAEEFMQSMKERLTMPADAVEICTILGKEYKLIMITTPEGLKDFLKTYFIDSKPAVLGIDSEAYKFKLSLFQMATTEWCCIIDIFLLSRHLSPADWTFFFQQIFDPSISRIGFAFHADYNFIQIAFPHVCSMLEEENQKVLCLSTLSKAILGDSKVANVIFHKLASDINQITAKKSQISLADVSKAILGIKLSKDQQSSDWNWRPLTEEQKIYAVKDAIIVILIKEKIENDLKNAFGDEKAAEIMEKGYICHRQKPQKAPKAKRQNEFKVTENGITAVTDAVIGQEN